MSKRASVLLFIYKKNFILTLVWFSAGGGAGTCSYVCDLGLRSSVGLLSAPCAVGLLTGYGVGGLVTRRFVTGTLGPESSCTLIDAGG